MTEARIQALLDAMTVEEKMSQLLADSPGIERLGILPYNWWSEALHGVASAAWRSINWTRLENSQLRDSLRLQPVAALKSGLPARTESSTESLYIRAPVAIVTLAVSIAVI